MAAKGTSTSNFLCDFIPIFGIIHIMNIAILKSKIGAKGKGQVTFQILLLQSLALQT